MIRFQRGRDRVNLRAALYAVLCVVMTVAGWMSVMMLSPGEAGALAAPASLDDQAAAGHAGGGPESDRRSASHSRGHPAAPGVSAGSGRDPDESVVPDRPLQTELVCLADEPRVLHGRGGPEHDEHHRPDGGPDDCSSATDRRPAGVAHDV